MNLSNTNIFPPLSIKVISMGTTIPGLTPHLIIHHLPPSTVTNKGHMQRHLQGVQTTWTKQPAILQACSDVNCLQPKELCSSHDMFCFAALADLHTRIMYTDGTGAFPVQFFRNMQYVFVAYIYNLKAILVCVMPSKTNGAMIAVFMDILANLNARRYASTLNVMDNECFKAVKSSTHLKQPHGHPPCPTPQSLSQHHQTHDCNVQRAFYICPCHSQQELPAATLG